MEILPEQASLGSQRVLYDAALFDKPPVELFAPQFLVDNGLVSGVAAGRGEAWFFQYGGLNLVLRHFRRGGVVEKLLVDKYLGISYENSRSWREWMLLLKLYRWGLPVPRPVAANFQAGFFFYRADLITERIPEAFPLADCLKAKAITAEYWHRLGLVIALFHSRGVWHPDLNARNILLDKSGEFHLIDFDRGRFGFQLGPTQNLNRLLRSLNKIKRNSSVFYFDNSEWSALIDGYNKIMKRQGYTC